MEKIPSIAELCKEAGMREDIAEAVVLLATNFARMHVRDALKSASEKASLTTCGDYEDKICVNKESILTAYPLELIK